MTQSFATDDTVPPPPMTQLGQLEVDTFCTGCNYNLHGQVVTLDDRLKIPVCRCPECGQFHPAGTGVTANSVWLRRFATLLLFVWVWIVIAFIGAELLAMAGVTTGSIEPFTEARYITPDGKPAVQKFLNNAYVIVEEGTDNIVPNPGYVLALTPWTRTDDSGMRAIEVILIISALAIALGFLAGALCVTLLWHWPRQRYFWCLLLPILPAAFLMYSYARADRYEFIRRQVFIRIGIQTGLQCAGILLGVMLGRKLARTLARVFIPPKPRQMLAFLWLVDHKPLPRS